MTRKPRRLADPLATVTCNQRTDEALLATTSDITTRARIIRRMGYRRATIANIERNPATPAQSRTIGYNLRLTPELHAAVSLAAVAEGVSMQQYLQRVISQAIEEEKSNA